MMKYISVSIKINKKIVMIYNYGFILYNVFYEEEILFKKLGIKWG